MHNKDHTERLKSSADPDRLATALGLRGQGGRYVCPKCHPDGVDRNASLSVSARGFKCFQCNQGGDLIELVRFAQGVGFMAAVAWLESFTGIRPSEGGSLHQYKPPKKKPARAKLERKPATGISPEELLIEFLAACQPVEGAALDFLVREKGISPEVVRKCYLHFCRGVQYPRIIAELKKEHGEEALERAGLLRRMKAKEELLPAFWQYGNRADFLVVPYIRHKRPIYLKARLLKGKEAAERLGLPRFLNSGPVPCLYNADILTTEPLPRKVLICEGESDTWAALSAGGAAVGTPGAGIFKPQWAEDFWPFKDKRGRSTVYLVPDKDEAGGGAVPRIRRIFEEAGLPEPLKIRIPSGKDLNDYLKETEQ